MIEIIACMEDEGHVFRRKISALSVWPTGTCGGKKTRRATPDRACHGSKRSLRERNKILRVPKKSKMHSHALSGLYCIEPSRSTTRARTLKPGPWLSSCLLRLPSMPPKNKSRSLGSRICGTVVLTISSDAQMSAKHTHRVR